jgi:hypothetical protein
VECGTFESGRDPDELLFREKFNFVARELCQGAQLGIVRMRSHSRRLVSGLLYPRRWCMLAVSSSYQTADVASMADAPDARSISR